MIRAAIRPAGGLRRRWRTALAASLLVGMPAIALAQADGEPASMKRETALRDAPGDGARSLAALPAQSAVTRLGERQGPWIRVRSAAGTVGWVHMFDVGPAAGSASAGSGAAGNALRSVTSFFSKGGPQQRPLTTATSTIGIRGLGAEDLAQAQPNPAALAQMEALRQGEGEARSFAGQAALAAVAVEPLPAPARLQPATGTGGQPGQPGQMP